MKYENLRELKKHSSSSRKFYYSQPIYIQAELSKYGSSIRTYAQLRYYTEHIEKYYKAMNITKLLL